MLVSTEIEKDILYVMLSDHWGTRERLCLRDILHAKKNHPSVKCVVLKDSYFHLRCKEFHIETILIDRKPGQNLLQYMQVIGRFFKRVQVENIKLIHCYDAEVIIPLGYYLRKYPHVSLVVTIISPLRKSFYWFWQTPFLSRVDRFLVPLNEAKSDIQALAPIKDKQVRRVGFGFFSGLESRPVPPTHTQLLEQLKERFWLIGMSIDINEHTVERINPLFQLLKAFSQREINGKKVKVVLVTEKKWHEHIIYQRICHYLKDNLIEDMMVFVSVSAVSRNGVTGFAGFQGLLDLWLTRSKWWFLEDESIGALCQNIPVLLPRKSTSLRLLSRFEKIGECYRLGDARELRQKCEMILTNHSEYVDGLEESNKHLVNLFNSKRYFKELEEIYETLCRRRNAYFKRLNRLHRDK